MMAVILLMVAGMSGMAWYHGYETGKEHELAACIDRFNLTQQAYEERLAEAIKLKQEADIYNQKNLEQVIHEKNNAISKLNDDLNSMRGLYITTKKPSCDLPREAKGPGEPDSGTSRERLPDPVEEGLWKLVSDAQKVVIQYEACRKALLPLVEIMD